MPNEKSQEMLAGSWIMDSGPGQFKSIASYVPYGVGKLIAVVFPGINFDWTLRGLIPAATHTTTLHGVIEEDHQGIHFTLLGYVLDESSKAICLFKAVGSKTLVDQDTLRVENLVFHFYNDPVNVNPVIDEADFCIPSDEPFPPLLEYRIKLRK